MKSWIQIKPILLECSEMIQGVYSQLNQVLSSGVWKPLCFGRTISVNKNELT